MAAFDQQGFRMALGCFATGVTIVTTLRSDGEPIGVTASSFNSVSLSPPMVLWSLDRSAFSLPAFRDATYFCVNVLAADQVELSNRFARAGEDKFVGLDVEAGVDDIPLLTGCSARFQCRTTFQHDGGDHLIFVGEVLEFDRSGRPGLVFHEGRYSVSAEHPMSPAPRSLDEGAGFVRNFLPYMSGLCHQRCLSSFQEAVAEGRLDDHQYRVLFSLRDVPDADTDVIAELSLLGSDSVQWALDGLCRIGMVSDRGGRYRLTGSGLEELEAMEQRVIASEQRMLSVFSADEARQFKHQLAKLIACSE